MSAEQPTHNWIQTPRQPARARGSDALVLDALEHGVIVADGSWRIAALNRAAIASLHPTGGVGLDLWTAVPRLDAPPVAGALRATMADRRPRTFRLVVADHERVLDGRVAPADDDRVVISFVAAALPADFPILSGADEQAALRLLARQLAAVADAERLLDMLAESALSQCRAAGAGVIATAGGTGEFVAASGVLHGAQGRRFALGGSIARDALCARRVVSIEDVAAAERPLAAAIRELDLGPVALAPLAAHDRVLGLLIAARERGAKPFSAREEQRLHLIADHAALALWKAELLEQAQAADRAKGRFLATVSHELRTPLTALTGYEELLADQVIGPLSETQLDVLERMRSVTHHLTTVIEEVLAFSSIEDGRERARATDFLVSDLLHAAAAVIEPLARQKRLTLSVREPVGPLRMVSDIDKIRQILVNIAANAVKFTDAGEVRLSVTGEDRGDEPWVCFAVHDTGIGIPEEDLERLFRPFVQLDGGLTRRHGGTGLGLYISRRLAQLLGGQIEVSSVVGGGSTFTVALPALLPVAGR